MEEQERGHEEKLSLVNLKRYRETIEIITRLGFVLLAGCYVAGLLILNLHLAQFGVLTLNILQVQYMMTGALWIFLIGFVYCFLVYPVYGVKNIYDEWKQGLRLSPALQVVMVIGSPAILVYVLEFFSGFQLGVLKGSTGLPLLIAVAILGLTAFLFSFMREDLQVLEGRIIEQASDNVKLSMRWGSLLFGMHRIVLIIGCISTYALLVFPKFSSALGGGRQQRVEFVVSIDHIATVNSIGLQVSPELRRVGPLEVIFESSDFFVLAPPKERQSGEKIKAIRIKKNLIDAALYLGEQE